MIILFAARQEESTWLRVLWFQFLFSIQVIFLKLEEEKMSMSKVEVGADNPQEKYLRELTRNYKALEKPLKYGPEIDSLQDLITALHKEFDSDYVDIEMVNHLMLSYKSDPAEWRRFAKFDRYKYTRNLVDAGNGKFNLIILCWGEGHTSAIHDHSDSHCFMKMLQGQLTETQYEMPFSEDENDSNNNQQYSASELQEIGKTTVSTNEVCYINGGYFLNVVFSSIIMFLFLR